MPTEVINLGNNRQVRDHEVTPNLNLIYDEVAAEIGNPAMLLTQAALQRELQRAADVVTTEMKAATKQVI